MSERDIESIIMGVKRKLPDVSFWQLPKVHAGDDNGLWFFSLPGVDKDIQLESPTGNCPFLVETEEQSSYQARTAQTAKEAIDLVVDYLGALRAP